MLCLTKQFKQTFKTVHINKAVIMKYSCHIKSVIISHPVRTHHFPVCLTELPDRTGELLHLRSVVDQQRPRHIVVSRIRLAATVDVVTLSPSLSLATSVICSDITMKSPETGGCSTPLKEHCDEEQVLKSNMDFTSVSQMSEFPLPTMKSSWFGA